MKKDHLPIWPSNTSKGEAKSIEVFFLGETKKVVVGKASFISKDKVNPSGTYTLEEACSILDCNKVSELSEVLGFIEELNEQGINENSTGKADPLNLVLPCCPTGPKGHAGWKGIKIDDTIPSDFVDTEDLVSGAIYKIAALKLTVEFVGQIMIPTNKTLIQVSKLGMPFYIDEGSLIKATQLEVELHINDDLF
jgi:hypothetical protein